jgi:hypothetical protein
VTETLPNLKALPKTVKMMDSYTPVFGETLNLMWAGSVSATEGCRQIADRVAAILKA